MTLCLIRSWCDSRFQARTPTPTGDRLRGVVHAALRAYLDRFLNVPASRLPPEAPADLGDLRSCWDTQGQVDRAGAIAYGFLRSGGDPRRLLAHLEAGNAYAEARTEHLGPLRTAIVEEIRSRVKETDLSVPVASGPWWYYARTVEGAEYPIYCRVRAADRATPPNAEQEIVGEEALLDGNVEAGDHEFFSIGAFSVSPNGRLLAYSLDRMNSIKGYYSSGASARTGTDFQIIGLAWQVRWGAGL